MRVVLTTLATDDLRRASKHYQAVDDALGARFLDALDRVVERLEMFPGGAPPVEGFLGVRRARRRHFPYGVFYRSEGQQLVVLRVLHTHRETEAELPR